MRKSVRGEMKSNEINVPKNNVLSVIREEGGISAGKLIEIFTGKTVDEQLREDISVNLHLKELEDEGSIVLDSKTLEWYAR